MKMMNVRTMIAAALAAVSSVAAGADILEMRPCTDSTGVTSYDPVNKEIKPLYTLTDPLTSVKEVYFTVRLISREDNTIIGVGETKSYWELWHNPAGGSEVVDDLLNPFRLGIVVSGVTKWADLVNVRATIVDPDGTRTKTSVNVTDLIFKYQVQPGEFALPIKLAADYAGTPVDESYTTSTFLTENTDKWSILYHYQDGVRTDDAVFAYNTNPTDPDTSKKIPYTDLYEADSDGCPNRLFSECGLYVKMVGFESELAEVKQNHDQTGYLVQPAGLDITEAATLYIWSEDSSIVDVAAGAPGTTLLTDVPFEVLNDAKTALITKSYNVLKVTVQGGEEIAGKFNYHGNLKDKSTKLVLSSFKGYNWKRNSAVPIEVVDYLTMPVTCVESEPEVTFKRTETTKLVYEVNDDFESWVTTFDFNFTDPYTEDLEVTVTPRLSKDPTSGKPALDWAFSDVIRLSDQASEGWNGAGTVTIPIKAGKTVSDYKVYVYGMGAAASDTGLWSDLKGQKIEFDITYDKPAAAAFAKQVIDFMYVTPAAPIIVNAAAITSFSVREGIAAPITINVGDNYTDRNDTDIGYRVMFLPPGSTDDDDPVELKTKDGTYSRFKPDDYGKLYAIDDAGAMLDKKTANQPAIPSTVKNGTAKLWLLAPNQAVSEKVAMTIKVTEAPKVTASFYETDSAATAVKAFPEVDTTTGDRSGAWVGITLSEACDDYPILYAFLEATDAAMYDYVDGTCLVNAANPIPIPITRGNTVSDNRHLLQFKDGAQYGTTLKFNVVLCETETYDPASVVDKYAAQTATITVNNVAPTVNDILMNGWPLEQRDGDWWISGSAAVGVPQKFTFEIYDSELDRVQTDDTKKMKFTYKFTGGKEYTVQKNPEDVEITQKFTKAGTSQLTLTVTDKDGGKTKMIVNIEVTDKPRLSIKRDEEGIGEDNGYFDENEMAQFKVVLPENPADINLTVKLTVTALATGTKRGDLQFEAADGTMVKKADDVYELTFKPGETEKGIYVSSADGTASSMSKFAATVEVTNTETYEAADVPWNEYFEPGSFNGKLTVNNACPTMMIDKRLCRKASETDDTVIELNSSNAPTTVAIGEAKKLTWSVDDVAKDLEGGISVTFTDQGADSPVTYTVYDTNEGEYTPTFKYAGSAILEITATDKDGGSITLRKYFNVKSSRMLNLTAVGPAAGSVSPHVTHYRSAGGLGAGHVWSEAKVSSSSLWSFYLNCELNAGVPVIGQGYRAGDIDDGTLNGGLDFAIDKTGKKIDKGLTPPEDHYYVYDDVKDSFFYCWVRDIYEDGSLKSEIYGAVAPEVSVASSTRVELPTETDDEGNYAETTFEAVFSRECLETDNIGDINNDGVPDVYVKGYGFDIFNSDGTIADGADDTKDLSTGNPDQDFFPATFSASLSSFIPGLSNTWVSAGRAYTSKLEIRGWDSHLNDAWQALDATGHASGIEKFTADRNYADPTKDATSTLSELEYEAYVQAGKPAGWSPERPTNPTVADTDGDGLPDGYEYYIWYKAHVGWKENGVHKYLTGRKYNPVNPYNPTEISSEEIAALYDPLTAWGNDYDTQDTDDDGIPDTVEFLTGTDPLDYDTDGDGLPDGYELYISKTDPLLADTNQNGTSDGDENPDNDSIAEYAKTMLLVSVIGSNGTDYYCCDGATLEDYGQEVGAVPFSATTFKVGSVLYVTTRDLDTCTYTDDAGLTRLGAGFNAKNTWQCDTQDGKTVRVATVQADQVRIGTAIDDIQKGVDVYDQRLTVVHMSTAWYTAYQYRDGYARGAKLNSVSPVINSSLLSRSMSSVKLLHWQVYQEKGFHSSTGWIHPPSGGVNTRSFTTMDEFLSMVFFHRTSGMPTADHMQVSLPRRTRTWIWKAYSTLPTSADTDGDMMPDGWEFYVMSHTLEDAFKAPGSVYSPIYNFALISDSETRDNDNDLLEWPHEYSGTSSSARYGWSPLKAAWRNKAEPTDPWDVDTDEDGIKDGYEGGYGSDGETIGSVVADNFMYNSSGTSGGGLNPLTWDTDGDGLPDPWEVEFHGTYKPGGTTTSTTQSTTIGEDGSTNTTSTTTTTSTSCEWNMDGMNATVVDVHLDYDHDGLENWQEYLVGTMRCWRYDDPESSWGMHTVSETELEEVLNNPGTEQWNQYWGERLADNENAMGKYNPHFANGYFDAGAAYFSCCRKDFDPCKGDYYYLADGVYHDQNDTLRWYDKAFNEFGLTQPYIQIYPMRYICCDPRNSDTDFDGMDDYYELFHGMNPLLGAPGVGYNGMSACDIVFDAYNRTFLGPYSSYSGNVSALNNWWCNSVLPHSTGMGTGLKDPDKGGYDFVAYPWLNGIAGADPDGDNIVNQEESIIPNVQAASTYKHTDPTPLWMTDSSYTNSLTRRYYRAGSPQGTLDTTSWDSFSVGALFASSPTFTWQGTTYKLEDFPGFTYNATTHQLSFDYNLDTHFHAYGWNYSFEENEGYDSDHDFLSDYEEAQGKTKNSSDPQIHDDPLRRQAMYFNGVDAFLETPVATVEWNPDPPDSATEANQNFLYYTVECWAKPDAESIADDAGLRTLVERAIWADNASAADESLMRKNFLIGVKNGRWYTCFDSTGTDTQPVEITDGPKATTDWTHIAATYDGTSLRLYVNGVCNNIHDTSIQPEHGVSALAINKAGEMNPKGGTLGHITDEHDEEFVAILVGASAKTKKGIVFDSAWRYRSTEYVSDTNPEGLYTNATTIADYHNFYKGYVDEVRIWDGARSAANIQEDYDNRTRYDFALAAENRQAVYNAWSVGGLRSPASETQLPAQLMYHFAFDHLAGAIEAADVIKVPAGFNADGSLPNARAQWSRPADYTERNWESTAVRSTVYTDCAYVPWINNTVAHLPRFDLTTLDSIYWSENYAGAMSAVSNGYSAFQFPRNAEVYSRWTQRTYGGSLVYYCLYLDPDFALLNSVDSSRGVSLAYTCACTDQRSRWDIVSGYGSSHLTPQTKDYSATQTDLAKAFRFALRDRHTCGDDILPMGGAYPKRISISEGGMWDNQSGEAAKASDAWAQTGADDNNNGLPNWWENYAKANYSPAIKAGEELGWDTTVDYNGVKMPAWQAYLRDLARGMIKQGETGVINEDYADTRDNDKDGLPDWWEEIYGLDTSVNNSDDDPDNDGLSNYHEYLLGEQYIKNYAAQFKAFGIDTSEFNLDPRLAFSTPGQVVPDYFLRYSGKANEVKTGEKSHFYMNEYFGEIATDHDFMEDWWENLYDVSYTNPKKYDPSFDKDGDGWSTYAECRAALWGTSFTASMISKWTGTDSSMFVPCYPQPIIGVRATYYGKQDISGRQLIVRTTSGQTQRTDATFVIPPSLDGQTRFIGGFSADTIMHGHLSPGMINANSVVFDCSAVNSDKVYVWNCDWYKENESESDGWDKGWYDGAYYSRLPWSYCSRIHSGSFEEYKSEYASWPNIELEGGDFSWESFVQTVPSTDLSSATLVIDGVTKFGTIDCTTGEYALDMSKFTNGDVGDYVFRVTYTSRLGNDWPQTVYVSDSKELEDSGTGGTGDGYVREGKNTIEAFIDLDGDGAYTVGEPYGVALNVDVGWHKTPVTVIELKDTSHVVPRFDVSSGSDDRTVVNGSSAAATTKQGDAADETTTGLTKKIAIRRTDINGLAAQATAQSVVKSMPRRTLITKTLTLDSRAYLTEADVLGNAKFDLDSKWLVRDAEDKLGIKRSEIDNATYEFSEVVTLSDGTTSNIVLKTFVNTFNPQRAKASTVAPINSAPVYSARPTFTFSSGDETMTAYRLQIARKDDGTVVYDSGDGEQGYNLQLLPARTSSTAGSSVYEVSPSVYVGARVCSGKVRGEIFEDSTDYQWRVALYNAKFNTIEKDTDWSDWADFEMDVGNLNRYPAQATGYGSASAAVRYYGPTNAVADDIWVEAYESADFRGQPVARITLSSVSDLANYSDVITTNAVLGGIAPGTYYFRAFIDFNGNGQRDDWESWGYANYVGKGMKAIYNPKGFEVTSSTADFIANSSADFTIYIEDCDTDMNELPDCLEEGFYTGTSGSSATDSDGDGIADSEEETYSTNAQLPDTDSDGMPDGYEALFADTDPTLSDASEAVDGDVMAFATEQATLIVVQTPDGADKITYVLNEGEKVPKRGDDVGGLTVRTTYDYPICDEDGNYTEYLGVGQEVTLPAGTTVDSVNTSGEIVLVHSQVYDKYGFDSTTATTAEGAANTKEFTALDKYLVVRYLEALGLADEDAVNRGKLWSEYTLKPYETDLDKDGIADGWELYTMFGPAGSTSVKSLDEVKISPWNPDDARELSPDSVDRPEIGTKLIEEYDSGNSPTDPWKLDSDSDGVVDYYAVRYHLKGTQASEDPDGDGLSNYAEYLISEVFKFAKLDPDNPKTDDSCVDYFRKTGDLYFGEIFTDHDQVSDVWEQKYSSAANRYEYDPERDDDCDGWSNWAEAKVGTDPSVASAPGADGNVLAEYPIPAVAAKVVYNGKLAFNCPIVFSAWSQKTDPDMTGTPDAVWVASSDAASTNVNKYVGLNPGEVRSYHLGTGVIEMGTVRVEFRDEAYEKAEIANGVEVNSYPGETSAAKWYYFVQDRNGELYTSITNQTPVKVGTVNYATGLVTIDFGCDALQGIAYDQTVNQGSSSSDDSTAKTAETYSNYDKLDLSRSYVRILWTPVKIDTTGNATYYLSDTVGDDTVINKHCLREGLNKFTVFADMIDENNTWDPGEPFGFVRDVDVNWQGGEFTVELTETSPIFARVNLRAGASSSDEVATGGEGTSVETTEDDEILTDRQYWNVGSSTIRKINTSSDATMDTTALSANVRNVRVRVVRTAIDGSNVLGKDADGNNVYITPQVVMDKNFNLDARSYLHEGDFLGDGEYDVDWNDLQEALGEVTDPFFGATNVTYTIYFGENIDFERAGGVSSCTNRVFKYTVDRVFDAVLARTSDLAEIQVAPEFDGTTPGIVFGSRPTFRWTMANPDGVIHTSYTSFRLQITTDDGTYSTGYRVAPAKDAEGYYSWTLDEPLEAIVGRSGNFKWSVRMYNSKYRSDSFWSDRTGHGIATGGNGQLVVDINNQQEMNDHGYSTIKAAVKYAGPEKVLEKVDGKIVLGKSETWRGKVRLQAFASADFAGAPLGEAIVTGEDELKDTTKTVANAAVHGLPQTGTYYLRAYIDSNGNGEKDDFESWGAADRAVTLDESVMTAPLVGIYIEDADTDRDWIPDAYEYAAAGWSGSWNSVKTKLNGKVADGDDILFRVSVDDGDVGTAGLSTGLGGASLAIFRDTQSFMITALGMTGDTASIEAIRAAVEKKVVDNTVRITSMALATDGSYVELEVNADVAESVAGKLVSSIYDIGSTKETVTVKVVVYRKENLATAEWTKIGTYTKEIGADDVSVQVPVSGVDMKSGFYKIEIEQ